MNQSVSHSRSIAMMCGSVVFFAANVLLLRWLTLEWESIDGWVATFHRGAVGVALTVSLFWKDLNLRGLCCRPLLIARGVIGSAGITVLYLSIDHMSVGRATLLNLTYPLFGTIIAAIVLKEKPKPRAFSWMLVAFGGLICFLWPSAAGQGVTRWDLVALFGAVTAGVVIVVIRFLGRSETTATIYGAQCLWSLIIACPIVGKEALQLPPALLLWLAASAVLVTFAQLLMTQAYRQLSTAGGSAIQMVLPVIVAVGGLAFFDERFGILEATGAIIVLFATWRVIISK